MAILTHSFPGIFWKKQVHAAAVELKSPAPATTKHKESPIMSINAFNKYATHRSNVAYMCINNWNFPEEFKDCLSSYYLLHWEGKYFGEKLKQGTIIHQDEEYTVVYKNCTYFSAKHAKQIVLSFRKPQPEFKLPGYVIVSVLS